MMNKLYSLLTLLMLGSSAFAMNQPDVPTINNAQVRDAKLISKQDKLKKSREIASVLTKAFCELPKSTLVSGQDRTEFQNKIQKNLPKVLAHKIGEYAGASHAPFVAQNIKKLIPCVVNKHTHEWGMQDYPPMQEMIKNVEQKLATVYQAYYLPHKSIMPAKNLSDKTYVLGVMGSWSFDDEGSKLRKRFMQADFANDDRDIFAADRDRLSDVSEWFENEYVHPVKVKPMGDNEFLGILYSDGTIGWKISPLNSARLKNKLFAQQLALGKELFSQDLLFGSRKLQIFKTLPTRYQEIMKSNFGHLFSPRDWQKHNFPLLRCCGFKVQQVLLRGYLKGCVEGLILYGIDAAGLSRIAPALALRLYFVAKTLIIASAPDLLVDRFYASDFEGRDRVLPTNDECSQRLIDSYKAIVVEFGVILSVYSLLHHLNEG